MPLPNIFSYVHKYRMQSQNTHQIIHSKEYQVRLGNIPQVINGPDTRYKLEITRYRDFIIKYREVIVIQVRKTIARNDTLIVNAWNSQRDCREILRRSF